jgi:ATP-dependent Clp protease ATP-binding subunit ClpB
MNSVFQKSEEIMKNMEDKYLTTEHLFLAMLELNTDLAKEFLFKQDITEQKVKQVIQEYRNGDKIESQDPELALDILSKYGRDLTLLAEQ